MLPKYHILLGIMFTCIIYWFVSINIFQASLIFLASILIDFDHYIWYVQRKKDFSLKNAYNFLNGLGGNGKKFILFLHTIEFHILIGVLIFIWTGFFYVLIGMIFHSISDIFSINLKEREFSFINYLISDKKNYL